MPFAGGCTPSGLVEGRKTRVPDPNAANWNLDLAAAEQLFVAAQEQVRVRYAVTGTAGRADILFASAASLVLPRAR